MEEITYKKFDHHYIFSHEPEVRVYLGSADPEDYIWDVQEQVKRSDSCYYYEIATGKRVDDLPDGGIHGVNYDYTCAYDFQRRLYLSMWGGRDKKCKYSIGDKFSQRLAEAWYLNQTPEEWDLHQEEVRLEIEKAKRENPMMYNLIWSNGEVYHVDDSGKRITIGEHMELMKKDLGEDCFEKA